jgi:hypothetical protein
MFTYRLHSPDGDDLGEATYPDSVRSARNCSSRAAVICAGAKLDVTNPRLTLVGRRGTLKIRNTIEWGRSPGRMGSLDGHLEGRRWHGSLCRSFGPRTRRRGVGPEATTPDRHIRIRFFGFLGSN